MPAPRFIVLLLSLLFGIAATPAAAHEVAGPWDVAGFAGDVQGGTRKVVFDDLDSLRRCLGTPGSLCLPRRAMTISPGIKRLMVAGAVTLDGMGLLSLHCDTLCLDLRQGGNNVVRGVRMAGPGPQQTLWPKRFPNANCTNPTLPKHLPGCAAPLFLKDVQRVLIENNEFSTCGNKCVSIEGGDAITLRRNHFVDSYFGLLAVSKVADGPFSRVTIAGNVFTRIFRRSARVSGHFVMHEIGNVFDGHCPDLPGESFGPSAVGNAQALVEGNFADADACSAISVSGGSDSTGEGNGHIFSRRNVGMEDRADQVEIAVPYAYPPASTNPVMRELILRHAGVVEAN